MTDHESPTPSEAPQVQTHAEYLALLRSPEFSELMRKHFNERLRAGIFRTYNEAVTTFATQDEHKGRVDELHDQALRASASDSPLLVLADAETESGELTSLLLGKVDFNNGGMATESVMAVTRFTDGVPSELYYSFTTEQVEILLRQGAEQGESGLSPATAHSMSLTNPDTNQ